jgi:hypothetical protein
MQKVNRIYEQTDADTSEVAENAQEVVHRRSFVPAAQGRSKPSNKDGITEALVLLY